MRKDLHMERAEIARYPYALTITIFALLVTFLLVAAAKSELRVNGEENQSTIGSKDRVVTSATVQNAGGTFVPDDQRVVDILPKGKNLKSDPLVYTFVLSETRDLNQGLTVRFPDHRSGGFICSTDNAATLELVIENLQKNFWDHVMHLSYSAEHPVSYGESARDYATKVQKATNADLPEAWVTGPTGTGGTVMTQESCFSEKQATGMSSRDQWYTKCPKVFAKFEKVQKEKTAKLLTGLKEFGWIDPRWKFEPLETYVVNVKSGEKSTKIFPGGYSNLADAKFDNTRCYTGGEVLDALQKYQKWENEQLLHAGNWIQGIRKNTLNSQNPFIDKVKKADKEAENVNTARPVTRNQ